MTPERWQQIEKIYHAVVESEESVRAAFLDEACAGDAELRKEVESLLAYESRAATFIESSALEISAAAMANDPPEFPTNRAIGPYQILSHIASGGMGEVFLAEDSRLGRKVVVKILPAQFTRDAERISRFELEARAASALNHPNIVTVYDIGRQDGVYYIVTEFIEGITLRKKIGAGRMDISEILDVAIQACNALAAAHQAGVLHRDIKPDNIMIRPDGLVKVLDLGLAKLNQSDSPTATKITTVTGAVLGTADHMSPEQARGQEVDGRTDLFALGVVMYEMAAGKAPFTGETIADVITSLLSTEPLPLSTYRPEIPETLESIINKALQKNRKNRYQTAKELLSDLNNLKRNLEFREEGSGPSNYASPPRTAIDTVAILPLANMSSDPAMDYFSDGVTESIINTLSKLPMLRVFASSTVFRYKKRDMDANQIGRELHARAVLSGRIRQTEDRLVISVEFIDVADGSQLWGEQYNRKLADIFEIQQEISSEITEKLRLNLTQQEKSRIRKLDTENVEAYKAYLKGRYFWNKRTAESLHKGVEFFRQAIDLDPGYAAAYSGLSDSYTLLCVREALSPQEGFAKAKAAAATALKIDDAHAEAHASMGHAMLHNWEWEEGEKELRISIERNPRYPSAHHWYSEYLTAMGRCEESIAELKLAAELDPLSLVINADLGRAYYYARRYDEVAKQEAKTLEMDPNFWLSHINLGKTYTQQGKHGMAIAELEKAKELSNASTEVLSFLAFAYAAAGKQGDAGRILSELHQRAKESNVPPYHFAIAYTGLGDRNRAFEWLERAFEKHAVDLFSLGAEPMFDPLRDDARFVDLQRRVGLTPQKPTILSAIPERMSSSKSKSLRVGYWAVFLFLFAAIGLFIYRQNLITQNQNATEDLKTLAVLPFHVVTPDPGISYLSIGIPDAIITRLSNLTEMRVRPTSSILSFQNKPFDLREVRKLLHVENVLTGTIEKMGERYRIRVQLIRTGDGVSLWGRTYDLSALNLLSLEDTVSEQVSSALQIQISPDQRARFVASTNSVEAYEQYLRGREQLLRYTKDAALNAISYFEKALEIDPSFAKARAGIAQAAADMHMRFAPDEQLPYWGARAFKEAQVALKMNPNLAEAHEALAAVYRKTDFQWDLTIQESNQALTLNSSLYLPHYMKAAAFYHYGLFDLAEKETLEAERINVSDRMEAFRTHAILDFFRGNFTGTITKLQEVQRLTGKLIADWYQGQAYYYAGDPEQAERVLRQLMTDTYAGNAARAKASLAAILAHSGRREEAESLLKEALAASFLDHHTLYSIGTTYAQLGNSQSAVPWLSKSIEKGFPCYPWFVKDSLLDPIRKTKEFQDLISRLEETFRRVEHQYR